MGMGVIFFIFLCTVEGLGVIPPPTLQQKQCVTDEARAAKSSILFHVL